MGEELLKSGTKRCESFSFLTLEILACNILIITSSVSAAKWYLMPYSQGVDKVNGKYLKLGHLFVSYDNN